MNYIGAENEDYKRHYWLNIQHVKNTRIVVNI